MPLRVTMRDIARHLGVHPSTVSLAFRDHPRIPAETRELVRKTGEELGYVPDPWLRALSSYRHAPEGTRVSAAIAWLNLWSPSSSFYRFREFEAYWRGASAAAGEFGYRLERIEPGENGFAGVNRMLEARGIPGVIIPPHHGAANQWDWLRCERLAVVRIGHTVRLPAHAVGCDQVGAGLMASQEMRRIGYRKIGYVSNRGAEASSRFRAGFLFGEAAVNEAAPPPALLLEGDEARDRRSLGTWLERNRPDALFSTHAALRGLLETTGIRVPDDLGLAVSSVRDGNADSGVDQRSEEIGRAAVELLHSLIVKGRIGLPTMPRMTVVSARWASGSCLPEKATLCATG